MTLTSWSSCLYLLVICVATHPYLECGFCLGWLLVPHLPRLGLNLCNYSQTSKGCWDGAEAREPWLDIIYRSRNVKILLPLLLTHQSTHLEVFHESPAMEQFPLANTWETITKQTKQKPQDKPNRNYHTYTPKRTKILVFRNGNFTQS